MRSPENWQPETITTEYLEGQISRLIDDLPRTLPARKKYEDKLDEVETDEDMQKLLEEIQSFISNRQSALSSNNQPTETILEVQYSNLSEQETRECANFFINIIHGAEQPANKLGSGQVAHVYEDPQKPNLCYKAIHNQKLYTQSNSTDTELNFLDIVEQCDFQSARTPKPLCFIIHGNFHAMVMEKLNAVSIDDILQRRAIVPPNFNFETFFSKLSGLLSQIHALGVHHRDLHEGNIMIDRETGDPYIIDFGAAKRKYLEDDDPYTDILPDNNIRRFTPDANNIKTVKQKLTKFLESID